MSFIEYNVQKYKLLSTFCLSNSALHTLYCKKSIRVGRCIASVGVVRCCNSIGSIYLKDPSFNEISVVQITCALVDQNILLPFTLKLQTIRQTHLDETTFQATSTSTFNFVNRCKS